jgi:hypothetical protein
MISANLDAGRALSSHVQHHVQTCPSCRDFYETSLHIGERLAAGARHERMPSPPFLQGRILAALSQPQPPPPDGLIRPAWAATALAAALVLMSVWFWRDRSAVPRQAQPAVSSSQGSALAVELVVAAARLPAEAKFREWGQKLDQPLETELKSVLHDARTALAGLAHSFLPDHLSPMP